MKENRHGVTLRASRKDGTELLNIECKCDNEAMTEDMTHQLVSLARRVGPVVPISARIAKIEIIIHQWCPDIARQEHTEEQ